MLSRLQATSHVLKNLRSTLISDIHLKQNVICKRWSGHNAMEITPSNADWKHVKNWFHFYFLISTIPIAVITTIINIRANPELSEVPEGYEPRHWEYYKHPITRWMAKYMYKPMELEHELMMSLVEFQSESIILKKVQAKVDRVMKFYNDHRSMNFLPFYGDYFRFGREEHTFNISYINSNPGHFVDLAQDPDFSPVPTEGLTKGSE